ncbi:hypothetical protein FRB98_004160 [Tulasnella sp. 332]|nr:hypothetical protein FRB98_004160 [Tulasnella sp. 332]
MRNTFTLLSAALLAATSVVATPCVVFDASWNLYAFGAQGSNDWNLGLQSSWAAGSVTAISKTNAPPFDGPNTQCFLSQFNNAIYVINGDKANPLNVHIFDPTAQSWSVQSTTAGGVDPTSVQAILDHDTNVFFGLSGGTLYQLDFSLIKATANSTAAPWTEVEASPFSYGSTTPAMAIADNHIFFMGIPANTAGEANIFVIHFAYFQPQVQEFAAASGFNTFPALGGEVTSLWQDSATGQVQQTFAFFPSDGSATYVVDVLTNTTYSLAAPPNATASGSSYAGSTTSLVQLASNGEIYYATLDQTSLSTTAKSASWSKINNNLWSATSASSSAFVAPGATGTGVAAAAKVTGSSTATGASAFNSSTANGAGSSKNSNKVLYVFSAVVVGLLGLAAL